MKSVYKVFLISFSFVFTSSLLNAQDVTTVEAVSTDISDNLDLRAVASLFGVCENIEDFEQRLNDPESQISNLDLNGDNEVDYLRVVEVSKNGTYVITIQAVIGKDQFQDVATIDVEKDNQGETKVQVVGDVYMYGQDYIIEPYYERPPIVYVYLWGPRYDPWYSPYYYGYYPTYYHPWNPYPTYYYIDHVHVHRSSHVTYTYTTHRYSSNAVVLQSTHRRVDYQAKNPEQSFSNRNTGLTNKKDLIVQREKTSPTKAGGSTGQEGAKPNTKAVQQDWKPSAGSTTEGTKVSVPVSKPVVDPSAKPKIDLSKDPNPRPAGETQAKPTEAPATKPAVDPYGRQPANTSVKQDPNARPASVGTSQPQNQQTKPAVNPTTVPATQQRTNPTQAVPQRSSEKENATPVKPTTNPPSNTKTPPAEKQPAQKPSKPAVKTGVTKQGDSKPVRP